jgi:hypothetical protein
VALVAAIGAIHEITEILTHSHAIETADIIINGIGVLIGVAIQRAPIMRLWRHQDRRSYSTTGASSSTGPKITTTPPATRQRPT